MQDKKTGALEEGEVITLKVVTLEELRNNTSDMKTMTALYLYDRYMNNQALQSTRQQRRERNRLQMLQLRENEVEKALTTINKRTVTDNAMRDALSKEWLAFTKR
jgi:hypothetical protein